MAVIEALQPENEEASSCSQSHLMDPRTIARGYQLSLCKKALEENVIVYLETGCGKTHIAVLLIYELRHLIRKPQKNVCVFLAPTVHLVQQQAVVIENSTNFKVKSYFGNSNNLDSHSEWEEEIEQYEVLVMTPEILLRNLRHCFMRMEFIVLLIFDECHHAQKRHPYAQIMKEFYKESTMKRPRIFGMTASPIIGKGGSNQLNYTKCINSLENLLDAKVYSVEDKEELESLVASPNVKFYFYDLNDKNDYGCYLSFGKKLEGIKEKCMSVVRENIGDLKVVQKKAKLLRKLHENLVFCLSNLGLWGALQAARILLGSEQSELTDMIEMEDIVNDNNLADLYLRDSSLVLDTAFGKADDGSDALLPEALEEPFFSNKLLTLIGILSTYRSRESIKCIIFVKRIITARSLACILGKLENLAFWKCEFLVGYHSGLKSMSRKKMNGIVKKFRSGEVNLLIATNVAEEGLDIQTCCLVIRFDLPTTVASFIQSRGRARMQQSEYVFLVERGNQSEQCLVTDFITGENLMNKEITERTSGEAFDELQESIYKVESTGASISTGCSVSLLHHYCSKLPRDEYFNPMPEFYFIDDLGGIICRIILPSNAPIHQIDGEPCSSKEEARRIACLKACRELHELRAFTDYLLPGQEEDHEDLLSDPSGPDNHEDEQSRAELHEMLVPAALRVPWNDSVGPISLNFYFVQFIPIPDDRQYRRFGLFLKDLLPKEAETMKVDLHLARGRIVKAELIPSGKIDFDVNEIIYAQNFQEMFLKIILDRSEFFADYIPLGEKALPQPKSSVFYLLLPVRQHEHEDKMSVDWSIIRRCLSSPVFRNPDYATEAVPVYMRNSLEFSNGTIDVNDIPNSLVLTQHNKLLFCVVEILYGTNGNSPFNDSKASSYAEYYKQKFKYVLRFPEQPLLKAKQLFSLHNLLHNRLQGNTEALELEEHFVELPPELCSFKVIGFPRDIASSLSMLPSVMHRLENLLVAIELKEFLSTSFPEGSVISANRVLEALTTEKCMERFSLERLEILGDAFLKYVIGRHVFLSYESLDEGQLTKKRSSIVNNSHLYKLATKSNLQMYIRDQPFIPSNFFALGRACTVICMADTERSIHFQGDDVKDVKCSNSHHWLHRKTIADVVEALVGAFIVDSGFKAATAFLRWIGIQVDFEVSDVFKVCSASDSYIGLIDSTTIIDIASVEKLLRYDFQHKGLLMQAFIHPSYNKHCGGCYQRLEFLGDAVLDYLITSYLYSAYPDLKPGQLTDLRSMTVNNNSFAHIAVSQSLHLHLISDSQSLSDAINKFVKFYCMPMKERDIKVVEEPNCPKVLGDLIESCAGAMLLDSGFNLEQVWRKLITLLEPVICYSRFELNPIRELQELCQSYNLDLSFSDLKKDKKLFTVEAKVSANAMSITCCGVNMNKRVAKRMAAQGALEKLKAKGYKHKVKSLKEVLQMSKKCEAVLIGFDERPATLETATVQLESLRLKDAQEAPSSGSNSNIDSKALGKEPAYPLRPVAATCGGTSEINDIFAKGSSGGEYLGSAKSNLFELCTAQVWDPPSFICVKSEGPEHLKLFTYKVIVEVKGAINTVLECYSEAKSKKKLAADHAAEGALWWLKHQGYFPQQQ